MSQTGDADVTKAQSLSHSQLSMTLGTVARQAPLSLGFSRQECWSGLPFPPPGDRPNPGIEPESPTWHIDSLWLSHLGSQYVCLTTWLCLTLCDPMDCSPPGSSVHGILQARKLEWVAMPFSRGPSRPRDRTCVSCVAGRLLPS